MQDQRDDREYQQQVDQTTSHVKHCESADPGDQQNDEQYCPDAHNLAPPQIELRGRQNRGIHRNAIEPKCPN
jgi:hypothetical protein